MAKRTRHMSPEKQAEYLAAGRGLGTGTDYQPWLKAQDVPSIGRASRIEAGKRVRHIILCPTLRNTIFSYLNRQMT